MADLDSDALGDQLEKLAIERKEGSLNVNRIAEVLDTNIVDVRARRSSGFRSSREAIEEAAKNKMA